MALQSALSRLRGNDEPPEIDKSRRGKLEKEKIEQVDQPSTAFSIEVAEKDLFDIDSDFFSDADLLLSSSPPHLPSMGRDHDNHPGSLAGSNCSQGTSSGSMVTTPIAQPPASAQLLMTRDPPQKSPSLAKKAVPPSTSHSPSSSSLEKLKRFTYTKTPSQRRGRGQVGGAVGGASQEPPAKKRSINPVSPSPDVHQRESVMSQEVVLPCTARSDQVSLNTRTVGISMPSQQPTQCQDGSSSDGSASDGALQSTRGTGACGGEGTPQNSGTVTASTFRRPIFNPRKSANSSTSASAPFARIVRDRKTDTHITAQPAPHRHSSTDSMLHVLSCSQTLTETHTPSTPQRSPHLNPKTTTPTISLPTPTPSSSSTPSLSRIHPSSTNPSSRTPSSQSLPFPPSSFSTPQRAPNTTAATRRFPGPAGVLPKLAPGQCLDRIVVPSPAPATPASTPRAKTLVATPSHFSSCSQPNTADGRRSSGNEDPTDFTQGPWKDMLQDLDMDDVYSAPLLQCNIARAIKQASRQHLRSGKVTHLRVMLKSIVPAGRTASAVLKDPTGEILCSIHHSILDEYQPELQPGAVFILRQVTVFSPAPRMHYLSITPDNIVRIYPVTDMATRRPLCLTEMERRFSDLTATKENHNTSQDNLSHSKDPKTFPRAHATSAGLTLELHKHNPSASQTSLASTPTGSPVPWNSHHHSQSTEGHSQQQPMDSVFSDQFFDDEFDSLVGSMDNGLEF